MSALIRPTPRRRVLVVDDSKDIVRTVSRMLEFKGCEVQAAFDGASAVAAATTWQPDVVFMDIGLPDESGYETAKRLRLHRALERTFLISLSGHDDSEHKRRAREAGFDLNLTKPMSLATLEKALARTPLPAHPPTHSAG